MALAAAANLYSQAQTASGAELNHTSAASVYYPRPASPAPNADGLVRGEKTDSNLYYDSGRGETSASHQDTGYLSGQMYRPFGGVSSPSPYNPNLLVFRDDQCVRTGSSALMVQMSGSEPHQIRQHPLPSPDSDSASSILSNGISASTLPSSLPSDMSLGALPPLSAFSLPSSHMRGCSTFSPAFPTRSSVPVQCFSTSSFLGDQGSGATSHPMRRGFFAPRFSFTPPQHPLDAYTAGAASFGRRPGLRTGPRFVLDTLGPGVPGSSLTDLESLPTYLNAAAAPSRLPAHKPVRLTQPKHPLAPPGTPVYFKYGEEHYPEGTVPAEYTFTETDGTVCRYITNFLVYNKRGERLLPVEVLDQPRHAALVLYGSLLPAASMAPHIQAGPRNEEDMRNKKRSCGGPGPSGKRVSLQGPNGQRLSKVSRNSDDWDTLNGSITNGSGNNGIVSASRWDAPTRESSSNQPTYPVRVELAEWCIDYGQEPCNVPFVWLISRWDVYYRLEKPAGRYIPTFASAKTKFEVSTRVIKTLQFNPEIEYRVLCDMLTAATRLQALQRRRSKLGIRTSADPEYDDPPDDEKAGGGNNSTASRSHCSMCNTCANDSGTFSSDGACRCNSTLSGESASSGSLAAAPVITKKKNRNWKIQSLSTPQGTGVLLTDIEGHPQPTTPWGAPYAIEGCRESTLLGLSEFLDSQLRNFMEGVGAGLDGSRSVCPNLVNTPFMRTLRKRTALRLETIQLLEAKRRALDVAKNMSDSSGNAVQSSEGAGISSYNADAHSAFSQHQERGLLNASPQFNGMFPPTLGPLSSENISVLEKEIEHLQKLLRSDDEDDGETGVDDASNSLDCCGTTPLNENDTNSFLMQRMAAYHYGFGGTNALNATGALAPPSALTGLPYGRSVSAPNGAFPNLTDAQLQPKLHDPSEKMYPPVYSDRATHLLDTASYPGADDGSLVPTSGNFYNRYCLQDNAVEHPDSGTSEEQPTEQKMAEHDSDGAVQKSDNTYHFSPALGYIPEALLANTSCSICPGTSSVPSFHLPPSKHSDVWPGNMIMNGDASQPLEMRNAAVIPFPFAQSHLRPENDLSFVIANCAQGAMANSPANCSTRDNSNQSSDDYTATASELGALHSDSNPYNSNHCSSNDACNLNDGCNRDGLCPDELILFNNSAGCFDEVLNEYDVRGSYDNLETKAQASNLLFQQELCTPLAGTLLSRQQQYGTRDKLSSARTG